MKLRTNTAVWLEKYERWQINVQKDNKRRSFTSSTKGKAGQREANAKADAWLDENITDQNMRIETLFDEYIEGLKITTCKDNWRQHDGFGRNWIKTEIGTKRINKLNEQDLQSIINKGYEKNLSKKTLTDLRACLVAFVKYCRKRKVTTLFLEDLVIPKGAVKKEKSVLQPTDLKTLFEKDTTCLKDVETKEIYVNAFRFETATGLRPGEVIGLEKSDIKGDTVCLRRSINRDGEETNGKNDNARRNFVLTPLALDILKNQTDLLIENKITSKYVFPSESGEPIKQTTYYKRWVRYRDYHKMSKVSPYELRHTFVSVVKSLPTGLLKPLVGHSENMDTYGVYSHELEGDMQITAALVQGVFDKILKDGETEKAEVNNT